MKRLTVVIMHGDVGQNPAVKVVHQQRGEMAEALQGDSEPQHVPPDISYAGYSRKNLFLSNPGREKKDTET